MSTDNLKVLLLGMLLGVMLLAGGMVFKSFSDMLHSLQVRSTDQGLLVQFEK